MPAHGPDFKGEKMKKKDPSPKTAQGRKAPKKERVSIYTGKAPTKAQTICGHNGNPKVVVPAGWKVLRKGEIMTEEHRVAWSNLDGKFTPVRGLAGNEFDGDRLSGCGCLRMVVIREVHPKSPKGRGK